MAGFSLANSMTAVTVAGVCSGGLKTKNVSSWLSNVVGGPHRDANPSGMASMLDWPRQLFSVHWPCKRLAPPPLARPDFEDRFLGPDSGPETGTACPAPHCYVLGFYKPAITHVVPAIPGSQNFSESSQPPLKATIIQNYGE